SLTVAITAIQSRLRLSGTNRLGFQPSMAISGGLEKPTPCLLQPPHPVLLPEGEGTLSFGFHV
ncbi:MAG: hypothetical protein KZQ65_10675, partial [Candidatus Thiodiazotropha sp. (ex Gloverina cf. vestifex)]|nr:hypothetical protein [Candidatus Thiodiazotropha sp. (ex Gloverina cf. vestifex)]